ncbi:MAG: hypothetical protein K6F37_09385 [Lachnospiraceae bacterium]|nr:hypothetical protein [Lachnospiraceae bacterium]
MMNGNIAATLLYVVALVVSVSGFFFLKKSSEKRNGFTWLVLSYVTVQLFSGMAAGVMTLLHIPVTIVTLGIIMLTAGVVMWIYTYEYSKRPGKTMADALQKYEVEKFDIILFAFVTLFVGYLLFKCVGFPIAWPYANTDAGLHLREATTIVRNRAVNGMYFNHLLNALIIEALEPFCPVVNWYKAYVVADCFHVWLEALAFAALIRYFVTDKVNKFLSLAVFGLYFMGYAFFCFYYAFEYWGMGTMMIAFVIMVLREYEAAKVERKYTTAMLMAGCFGLPLSYMLFAPFIYIFVFVWLLVLAKKEGKIFTKKNVFLMLKVFLLPCILGFYYCYIDFFVKQGDSVAGSINNGGGMYTELYIDFAMMFLPVIFFVVHHIREKKFTLEFCIFTYWLVLVLLMLALVLKDRVSPYYYYKFYYPMWLLSWMVTMQVVVHWQKYMREMLITYVALYGGLLVFCFGNIEYRIFTSDDNITTGYHSAALFTLYSWGKNQIAVEHNEQPADMMELYNWIIENLGDEDVIIPILTDVNDYGDAYLYEGIVGWDCGMYYGWRYTDEEVWERIENEGVNYVTILKSSQYFERHEAEIYDMNIAFENDAGYVISVN